MELDTYNYRSSKFDQYFYLEANIVISLTGDIVEVCSVHVRKSISHKHTFMAKQYTFHSFLAHNSTHIIYEVPNLISTSKLMLIVIILSFINWRLG